MRSFASLVLAAVSIAGLTAAPTNRTHTGCCKNPLVRHEWRQLSLDQRLNYIRSVKCLMALPSEGNDLWPGAVSRFDDFQGMHIYMTQKVYFNGPFLPWHRWMLYLYESELRNKCSYNGALPYWDVSLDNTNETFVNSPVFDNVYGVGGNGPYIEDVGDKNEFSVQRPIPIPGCIVEGPFANHTVPMGLGYSVTSTPHCLRRDFSLPIITSALSDEVINKTLSADSFFEFNLAIQGYSMQVSGMTLHAGLHIGIGGAVGDCADMYSSPGDPVFYFIHGALDKVWNDWQRRDWPARKTDIGGPDVIFGYPFNYTTNPTYENITLQYPLSYPNFGEEMIVAEMMDIHGGPFCCEYK